MQNFLLMETSCKNKKCNSQYLSLVGILMGIFLFQVSILKGPLIHYSLRVPGTPKKYLSEVTALDPKLSMY